jgi:hypothetical protein
MIAALCWKEYREHRAVWLAMAAGGGATLAAVAGLVGPAPERREALVATAVLLNWVYGLVCGGMLLAGEREEGTLPFLDALPAARGELWSAKCLAGLALVLGQALVLAALFAGFAEPAVGLGIANAWLLAVAGVMGLGWGLLFSAGGSTVLQVVGQGIGARLLVGLGWGLLLLLAQLVGPALSSTPAVVLVLVALGETALTVLAFAGSRRVFCRTDRQRRLGLGTGAAEGIRPRQVLGWLVWRQAWLFALVLPVFALGLGLVLLINGTILWPAVTLLLGLACGVSAFGDEQTSGAFRFLGDQRLPPGRVWLAKVGVRLALALAATSLALLPSLIRMAGALDGNPEHSLASAVFSDLVAAELVPLPTFLLLGVVHGFAVGVLCGVLFRKTLVAAVLGLGGSVLAIGLWLPSLAGGGLHLWQTLGVPLACLVASRLVLPAQSAGRLVSRGALARLGACGALAAGGTALALCYRVVEVPELPQRLDLAVYAASLPPPERNQAGQRIRSACENLAIRQGQLRLRSVRRPGPEDTALPPLEERRLDQLNRVLSRGWSEEADLASWMDDLYRATWHRQLREAAGMELGLVEDPRRLRTFGSLRSVEPARLAARLLAVHGLRLQAQGQDAAFVEDLSTGLALTANLDHHAIAVMAGMAQAARHDLLRGLERWLERLDGRADLLGEVLGVLQRHEQQTAADLSESEMAEQLMLRNTVEDLAGLVGELHSKLPQETLALWAGALPLARLVPWERERQRRLLVQAQYPHPRGAAALPLEDWIGRNVTARAQQRLKQNRRRSLTRLRATQLVVALRLYQAKTGRPAADLAALVPDYLPAVPLDPYNGKPLCYELATKDEQLPWPRDPSLPLGGPGYRTVRAGQGKVWSVGPDGVDGGGHKQAGSRPALSSDEDLIFLVPLPPSR